MLPKRRHQRESSPDHEYERVSARDIELIDPAQCASVESDAPSLSPMALELEEVVIALTAPRLPPVAATRPSIAWAASIFAVSALLSAGSSTFVSRLGAPSRSAGALAFVAPLPDAPPPAPPPPPPIEGPIAIPVSALPAAPTAAAAPRRQREPASRIDAGNEESVAAPSIEPKPEAEVKAEDER